MSILVVYVDLGHAGSQEQPRQYCPDHDAICVPDKYSYLSCFMHKCFMLCCI